jgi:hypothetical protein
MGINKCKLHHLHSLEEIYNKLLGEHSCYITLFVSRNSLTAPSCHYRPLSITSSPCYYNSSVLCVCLVIKAWRLLRLPVKQIASTNGGQPRICGVNSTVFSIYNGPTNALVCIKTLIRISQTKTFKITPKRFDHHMMIIRELSDPGYTHWLKSELPDDDHLMIETCWSDFKCFSV